MKRILFFALAIALVFSSVAVAPVDAVSYANVTSWSVEDGVLTIRGTTPTPCYTITSKTRVIEGRFDVRVYAKPQKVELCAQVITPFTMRLNVPPKKAVWVNGSPYPPYMKIRR